MLLLFMLLSYQKMRSMYFIVVNNMLSERNRRFNNSFDFLTALSVCNRTSNNMLKCINYYDAYDFFLNKVMNRSRLVKYIYSNRKNIMDFYK